MSQPPDRPAAADRPVASQAFPPDSPSSRADDSAALQPKLAPPHKPLPVYAHPPDKVFSEEVRPHSFSQILDTVFFVISGLASIWLGVLLARDGLNPDRLWYWIPFFVVLSYLVLPRLHRTLTWIYVPDYFIGRTRTSDGLLGDPVNLAFQGSEKQIHQVMEDAGWVLAQEITFGTAWKMAISSILKRSYPQAPVSPLFLFGNRHNFAYQQEVDENPHTRHHVRFFKTPQGWLLPGGRQVDWLAAGTYDRSVGLSLFTLQVTHRIDRNIDVERNYIVNTVEYRHPEVPVEILEDFSTGYHSRNGGGDLIQTDGDLPIVDVSKVPTSGSQPLPRPPKRPALLILGCALLLLMSVGPVVWISLAALQPGVVQDFGFSGHDIAITRATLFGALGVGVLVLTSLSVATAFGVVWTRTVLLFGLTAYVIGLGVTGADTDLARLTIFSLAILALLSLSSSSVRRYVETKRRPRTAAEIPA